jgi:hypothetical protein
LGLFAEKAITLNLTKDGLDKILGDVRRTFGNFFFTTKFWAMIGGHLAILFLTKFWSMLGGHLVIFFHNKILGNVRRTFGDFILNKILVDVRRTFGNFFSQQNFGQC